jgi:hypothetical protein
MCSNLNVAEIMWFITINGYSTICDLHMNHIIKSEADIHKKKCIGSSVTMEIIILNSMNSGKRLLYGTRSIHKISYVCKYCCCSTGVTMVHMRAEFIGPFGRHVHHLQTLKPRLRIILCVYDVQENREIGRAHV